MEKLILKKIRLALTIISFIILLMFLCSLFFREKEMTLNKLEETIKQIELLSDQAMDDTESTKTLFEEDYLNRAYAIDYMLTREEKINNSTLEKIKELMEVELVALINNTGEIVYSTNQAARGLHISEVPKPEPFLELFENSDKKAHIIQWDGQGIGDGEPIVFVGIKASSPDYSIVRIGFHKDVLEKLTAKNSIHSIVKSMPSIEKEAYFVIGINSGELESITLNNDQNLMFDNVRSKEEFMAKLKIANKGIFLKINGSIKLLKTKIIDDKIIGVYVDGDTIGKSILLESVFLVLGIFLFHLCVYLIVKRYVNKYVLKDIYSIEFNIKKLMNGNKDVTFTTEHDTEFQYIMTVLNQLKNSYKYKSERMTRIISSIGSHVAVFECLYEINEKNFTDNIQSILGIDDDTWNEIIKSPKGLEEYLQSLMSHSEGNIISLENGKFVRIDSFSKENEFYGMIMDKTEDVKELREAKKHAKIDSLTNLMNRAGLEKYIKKSLDIQPGKGIMVIFDLDNFKQINDSLGHPEGDKVLKQFANCLNTFFKSDGIVARMGGDEFVVFIHTNINTEEIVGKLNSFLSIIRKELNDYYDDFGLSTSIGVAYVDPLKNNYEDLYKCADIGLYEAKKIGKDRFYINNAVN